MKILNQLVWIEKSDRFINVEMSYEGEIKNVNYSQGNDEDSENFAKCQDEELTRKYKEYLKRSKLEHSIETLDEFFWMLLSFEDKDLKID